MTMRLPMYNNNLRVTFALTAGLHACWGFYAIAAEKQADSPVLQTLSSDTGEFSPSEFDIRWMGGQRYNLASSGSIVPSGSPEASSRRDAELYEIDANAGSAISNPRPPVEVSDSKQFGNGRDHGTVAKTSVAPGACGPSPLAADGIHALVVETAKRHGVDPDLAVAVASAESDLDRNRNSPKGARGPMQLMPATAVRFGVANPCEPVANIDAGVRYLDLLLDEFKNPILAIAAYNAGEDRIYQYGGIPPFPETVSYVAKVVNHQLGLQMPRRKPAKALQGEGSDESLERGVVVTGKRRQWIAGVMQF
jgi:soluble lytic murein transglycosylase-like protein